MMCYGRLLASLPLSIWMISLYLVRILLSILSISATVLQLLRDNQLYAKMSKCTFAQPELEFLGHVLGRDGLRVDPRKTAVVAEWPVPRDLSQLRSFLGMANYFRKFIQNYAQRTLVLTRMLREGQGLGMAS